MNSNNNNDAIYQRKERLFDRWAANYDILFTTVFYQAIHKRLLEYLELPEKATVLDLGCGTGRLLNRLAGQFPELFGTGVDLSKKMLREARKNKKYPQQLIFVGGNAEALPFFDGQFDAIFNTISFLHYPNPKQVFSEVSRVLTIGGRFYLVDYVKADGIFSLNYFRFFGGGINFYSPEEREKMGNNAGLQCFGHYYLLGPILLTVFTKK